MLPARVVCLVHLVYSVIVWLIYIHETGRADYMNTPLWQTRSASCQEMVDRSY
jgi:hypothetical protein